MCVLKVRLKMIAKNESEKADHFKTQQNRIRSDHDITIDYK